jgi:hypothetical protein
MKLSLRKRSAALPLLLCSLSIAPLAVHAQNDGVNGPPNVLLIQREFLKPGKGGMLHEATEGAFIRALDAKDAPIHYFALNSMTGPDRALFFSGYVSFAAMEAEHKEVAKITGLEAALDRANVADGDLLASTDASIWTLEPELSNSSNLAGARFMEISQYVIKPGHRKQWEDIVKIVKDTYAKEDPSAHWTMFSEAFGAGPGDVYLVVWPEKSMADIDAHFANDKAFGEALGAENRKKLSELESDAIETEMTNLFSFNPAMSHPPEEWVKAEPDFWKHKPMAPAKKPAPAAKPAQ